MQVVVRRLIVLEDLVPDGPVELPEGSRLGDLVSRLAKLHGPRVRGELTERGCLRPDRPVLINGRGAAGLGGLEAPLQDGDEVVFLVPLAGGGARGRSSEAGASGGVGSGVDPGAGLPGPARPEAGLEQLEACLARLGRVAVAFSGGVDSGLVLAAAMRALGPERLLALTADFPLVPRRELDQARFQAGRLGAEHLVVPVPALEAPGVRANPPERCYLCKLQVFGCLRALGRERGFEVLVDGANADDTADFRPGFKAARELGVKSPLLELGLGKARVREMSRSLGLPGWDRPSQACLATRIPTGQPLSPELLARVEAAEDVILGMGLRQVRVRHHGDTARIEVEPAVWQRILERAGEVSAALRSLGWRHVTLDLEGYRTGSMNPGDSLRVSRRATDSW